MPFGRIGVSRGRTSRPEQRSNPSRCDQRWSGSIRGRDGTGSAGNNVVARVLGNAQVTRDITEHARRNSHPERHFSVV